MNLRGRGTLITGASRGLGAALARELGRRGAKLVLVARESGALGKIVKDVIDEGGEAHALPADIGDKSGIYPLAGAASALVGPIDLLVHNASTLGRTPLESLLDTDCEDLDHVLQVNLVGPFRLTRALVGSMALRKTGLVLHVTSDASTSAYPGWGAYSVSKAGLDHMGRLWAIELANRGVHFLTVDPGEMNTRMHAEAMPEADPATLPDPALAAATVARMIEAAESFPNGARIEAARWSEHVSSPLAS
jgi:NAD(P)-dependent dehydrogenase (short-subunit alcohol dehydrogenase family)